MPVVLALLPILTQLGLPSLITHLFGARASTVAAEVAQAVTTVVGSADPEAARAAMADPGKAAELQAALAKVAADADTAARQAELSELVARLGDVADARAQTVSLATSHSPIAYGAPVVSLVVSAGFIAVVYALMFKAVPADSKDMLNILMGTLSTCFIMVVGYWVGSSAGSKDKDGILGKLAGAAEGSIRGGR